MYRIHHTYTAALLSMFIGINRGGFQPSKINLRENNNCINKQKYFKMIGI